MYGRVVITQAIHDWISEAAEYHGDRLPMLGLQLCLARHFRADWGDLDDEDKDVNRQAFLFGGRILSSYMICDRHVWIITDGFRNLTDPKQDPTNEESYTITTILFPDDY